MQSDYVFRMSRFNDIDKAVTPIATVSVGIVIVAVVIVAVIIDMKRKSVTGRGCRPRWFSFCFQAYSIIVFFFFEPGLVWPMQLFKDDDTFVCVFANQKDGYNSLFDYT